MKRLFICAAAGLVGGFLSVLLDPIEVFGQVSDPVGSISADTIQVRATSYRMEFSTTATCDDYRWQGDYMASGKFTEGPSTRTVVNRISRDMRRTATVYCASEDRSEWSANGLSVEYVVDAVDGAPPPPTAPDTMLAARVDSLENQMAQVVNALSLLDQADASTNARIDTLHQTAPPPPPPPPPAGDAVTFTDGGASMNYTVTWADRGVSDYTLRLRVLPGGGACMTCSPAHPVENATSPVSGSVPKSAGDSLVVLLLYAGSPAAGDTLGVVPLTPTSPPTGPVASVSVEPVQIQVWRAFADGTPSTDSASNELPQRVLATAVLTLSGDARPYACTDDGRLHEVLMLESGVNVRDGGFVRDGPEVPCGVDWDYGNCEDASESRIESVDGLLSLRCGEAPIRTTSFVWFIAERDGG